MKYERFKQIWNEILGDSITESDMTPETKQALIEYSQGNKTKIEEVRRLLGR